MHLIISRQELYYFNKALGLNRLFIMLLFFIPMLVFAGIFSVSLALITDALFLKSLKLSSSFSEVFMVIFALLPPLIFIIASRIYREKRLIPKSSMSLLIDGYFLKVGSLELPLNRVRIEIVENPFMIPKDMCILRFVFPFEFYLYKEGEGNLSYFYEYRISGVRDIKRVSIGSTIAIIIPIKKEKIRKLVESLKEFPNLGVNLSDSKEMRYLFKDFEEKKAARIILKNFSFIGF